MSEIEALKSEVLHRIERLKAIANSAESPTYWEGQLFAYRKVMELLDLHSSIGDGIPATIHTPDQPSL